MEAKWSGDSRTIHDHGRPKRNPFPSTSNDLNEPSSDQTVCICLFNSIEYVVMRGIFMTPSANRPFGYIEPGKIRVLLVFACGSANSKEMGPFMLYNVHQPFDYRWPTKPNNSRTRRSVLLAKFAHFFWNAFGLGVTFSMHHIYCGSHSKALVGQLTIIWYVLNDQDRHWQTFSRIEWQAKQCNRLR